MDFVLALFAATTLAYLASVVIWMRKEGGDAALGLVGALLAIAVFFLRSKTSGTSFRGTLLGASLLHLTILAVTLGRPHDLFDMPAPRDRRLTKRQRRASVRRAQRTARSQGAFLLLVVVGVVTYNVAGFSFLN